MFEFPNIASPIHRTYVGRSLILLAFSMWPASCNVVAGPFGHGNHSGREAMKRCDNLVDVGRRQFLSGAGAATAAVAAATLVATEAKADTAAALVKYPSNRLASLAELKVNEPFNVSYPDADAPGVLIKLGQRVPGGAGPDGDVVGFSTTCPHKGFPLSFNKSDKTMNCPGHYSRFDCEKGGQQVWGQATQNLPQYALRVDDKGDVYAEGVDELLYGRLSNIL
jgi:arsenite oxidase small subunit